MSARLSSHEISEAEEKEVRRLLGIDPKTFFSEGKVEIFHYQTNLIPYF
jgi:hydrogenase maturation factor